MAKNCIPKGRKWENSNENEKINMIDKQINR
jgi:hypothetical protein